MNREAGYNFLNTAYTGTSAAYLSGLGTESPELLVRKIIGPNDKREEKTTKEGEKWSI